jgi:hypothetical protein
MLPSVRVKAGSPMLKLESAESYCRDATVLEAQSGLGLDQRKMLG